MNDEHRHARRGTITVVMLICMLIATALAASTLHNALLGRRETQQLRQMRQTELLLDAGVLRAVAQRDRDPKYQGETWQLPDSFGLEGDAIVKIDISEDDSPAEVHVQASIQPRQDLAGRTQRSLRFQFP